MQPIDYIVVGGGLTGLTTAFALKEKGHSVVVLEASGRTGGQIRTFTEKGYTFESGPNTGVVAMPEVVEIFEKLTQHTGEQLLQTARPEAHRRLIWKSGQWQAMPNGPKSGCLTPLISWKDKLRLLLEPWQPQGKDPNESIATTTRRRLGKSYVDYFVDPFISGIYAGDPERIVTRFALPKLYALEQKYGSFIRGAIAKRRQAKTQPTNKATREVFSAKGGMETLTKALTNYLSEQIFLNCQDLQLHPDGKGWKATFTQDGIAQCIFASQVITATPAYSLSSLLPFIPSERLSPITELRYAPVVQVCVGMKVNPGQDFLAFGGLVPSCEGERILGVLFPSSSYPERAPEGCVLLSFFLGGIRHPEMVHLSDEDLRIIVQDALHRMLHFPKEQVPELFRIFRHRKAIPQYEASSEERLRRVLELEDNYQGLTLAGNLKDGIGLANRLWQGWHATELHELTKQSFE